MVHNSWSLTNKLPDPMAGYRANTAARPIDGDRQSPRCWRKLELEGVGLGIVAALERASGGTGATAATPISIVSPRAAVGHRWRPEAAADLGGDRTICCAATVEEDEGHKFRVAEFLNHCHLCRKRLHGEDIYIYRGEKAFCSEECRHQQIINDEYQEKHVGAAQPPEISSSPCSVGGSRRLFFTGILVS